MGPATISRVKMDKKLGRYIKRQSMYQDGSNAGLQGRQKSVLKDVMHVILNSGLKQIIDQMDLWFTKENLDYPDKC